MDVTLIHNPSSGDENHSAERIRSRIEDAGHLLTYQSAAEEGWEDALERHRDLVAVAGGDGTVGEVMRRLAGRSMPLTILPAGTANNIAASLGLAGRSFDELIQGWVTARRMPYVLGEVDTGGHSRRFVEAVGGGIVAAAIERAKKLEQEQTSSEHGMRALRSLVDEFPAEPWELEADGDARQSRDRDDAGGLPEPAFVGAGARGARVRVRGHGGELVDAVVGSLVDPE